MHPENILISASIVPSSSIFSSRLQPVSFEVSTRLDSQALKVHYRLATGGDSRLTRVIKLIVPNSGKTPARASVCQISKGLHTIRRPNREVTEELVSIVSRFVTRGTGRRMAKCFLLRFYLVIEH